MNLETKLTAEEVADRNAQVVKLLDKYDERNTELSEIRAEIRAELKTLLNQMRTLRNEARACSAKKDVEVEDRPNYDANRMDVVRLDTGETVHSRELQIDERQDAIPFAEEEDDFEMTDEEISSVPIQDQPQA